MINNKKINSKKSEKGKVKSYWRYAKEPNPM